MPTIINTIIPINRGIQNGARINHQDQSIIPHSFSTMKATPSSPNEELPDETYVVFDIII